MMQVFDLNAISAGTNDFLGTDEAELRNATHRPCKRVAFSIFFQYLPESESAEHARMDAD
jgi:hypothetical protein